VVLARARIMGAKYPWYLLKGSEAGQRKEAELTRTAPATAATCDDSLHGFVYRRVSRIALMSNASNAEIDTIWDQKRPAVEAALAALDAALQADPPAPVTVQTGGRKGATIDFAASGEVELPSGEMARRTASWDGGAR
jgi:adenine-specific DNA-methyltransferase